MFERKKDRQDRFPWCVRTLEEENARLKARLSDLEGEREDWTYAEARIDVVLALHVEGAQPDCWHNRYCSACGKAWPCPTVQVLKGHHEH